MAENSKRQVSILKIDQEQYSKPDKEKQGNRKNF